MKIFNIDSPLMQALSKMADLMWLNILTIFCCVPIITIGPAFTAMHYVALKIVRDEESYITQSYFKSFKDNFKQATVMWLLILLASAILLMDYFLVSQSENLGKIGTVVGLAVGAAAVLVLLLFMYSFPVLAKFDNSVSRTMKNAFVLSLMQFPKTLVIFASYVISFGILFYAIEWLPVFLFFGLSGPAWVTAKMVNKLFAKLEDQIREANAPEGSEDGSEEGEDERIFKDELDESLISDENKQ